MRIILLLVLLLSVTGSIAQNSDTSLIPIANFKLFPGTFSWRGTGTFHNMTSWDSSPYEEGHLKQKNGSGWSFRLNYRLLFPKSYDANYKDGYPLLILLHGAGERGNCWVDDCYCNGCDPNATPNPDAEKEFLNNDHMLQHGGKPFLDAVNLAGSKKVGDESLNGRAFPGFVLFPQAENYWGTESSNSPISYALRVVRLVTKEYNINPDRVYISGLSMGGQAVLKAVSMADWLFAAAIAMSPLSYHSSYDYEGAKDVPLWVFQGGLDTNPKPSHSEALVNKITQAGGTIRYTFYPELGHNTWTTAFKEPEFFSWLLQFKKNTLHAKYNNPYICSTTRAAAELNQPPGFLAYQWEKDGAILPNETNHILSAKEVGMYRGRFSRISGTPGASDWNEWSAPMEVYESRPETPVLRQTGTTFLPDLNGNDVAFLYAESTYPSFAWEKDNSLTSLPDSTHVQIKKGSCVQECANNGTYKVRATDLSGCPSMPSGAKYLYFNNTAPVANDMKPDGLSITPTSSSSAFLTWTDRSKLESGFEIWRKNNSRNDSKWELAAITAFNVTFYHDTLLIPKSVYHYKIRAINDESRSDYYPGNAENENIVVTTPSDNDIPLPPQNLTAELNSVSTIKLKWRKGYDESGIRGYVVNYNGSSVKTNSKDTTFILTAVELNKIYAITVSTVDISGNVSSPSNQVMVLTQVDGLFYKHTPGAWKSLKEQTAVDTWSSPEFSGRVSTLVLTPRVQDDYFNFQFEGYLNVAQGGDYTFYLNSDDGSILYIDGVEIINNDGLHGRCSGNLSSTTCPNGWGKPSSPTTLTAGPHLIKVEYLEYIGSQSISVLYNGPDTFFSTMAVPEGRFSSGSGLALSNPTTPGSLSGSATGMTGILLEWDSSSPSNSKYEIYRAATETGPFAICAKVDGLTYADGNLNPGKTYYYRLRAVSETGVSGYTAVIAVKTLNDNEDPSTPQGLQAESGNFGRVILKWSASTDNVKVKGYEILADGERVGFSKVPAFDLMLPETGQLYTFTVVAVDLSNNVSAPSNPVNNELFITAGEDDFDSLQLLVYPNPQRMNPVQIVVKTRSQAACRFNLSDPTGRVIQTFDFIPRGAETLIDVNALGSAGVYIINVKQGDQVALKKLLFF